MFMDIYLLGISIWNIKPIGSVIRSYKESRRIFQGKDWFSNSYEEKVMLVYFIETTIKQSKNINVNSHVLKLLFPNFWSCLNLLSQQNPEILKRSIQEKVLCSVVRYFSGEGGCKISMHLEKVFSTESKSLHCQIHVSHLWIA